jgi:hypothetical protein
MVAVKDFSDVESFNSGGTDDGRGLYRSITVRHFSLWPFGTRSLRLLVLLDPSRIEPDVQQAVLRAMQATCFGSDPGSLTSAVRSTALAAHYVLRAHNRDALPQAQVTAAVAVALVREHVAYVALVGDAGAFTRHGRRLWGHHNGVRQGRPLGLEQEPRVSLWSTPPRAGGDRLVLVCGAKWQHGSADTILDVLTAHPTDVAQRMLAEALGTSQAPARVLVDNGSTPPRRTQGIRARPVASALARRTTTSGASGWRRWLASLLPVLLLAMLIVGAVVTLRPIEEPRRGSAPAEAAARPDALDRVFAVQAVMAVRFGPSGANVVDLTVARDRLFTLDVQEGAVRTFDAQATEQWPTPDTVLARKGAPLGSRSLDTPVAIQYLPSDRPDAGALTIIDRSRNVVQLRPDGVLAARGLASSAAWQRLGALSADSEGNLYVLDSGARTLLEYPLASQRLVDPPTPLLEAPGLSYDRIAEILALQDLYVRLEDGTVQRTSRGGQPQHFAVSLPDVRLGPIVGLAADRAGGLYLADPTNARIVHTTATGEFVRQLRDPALAGVRQIQTSLDGRRLFGLVATGVLSFDIPSST